MLHPDLWSILQPSLSNVLKEQGLSHTLLKPSEPVAAQQRPRSEPISDWEELMAYWDFSYPIDYDVTCEHCGAHTDNWQKDSPRKFYLSAANLGGLVSFECQCCGSRIIKKHFEDTITTECNPCQRMDPRKMGQYSEQSGLVAKGDESGDFPQKD
jgi:hypothetical protein